MSIDIINEPTLFFIKRWHIVSVAVSSPHNLSLSKTATPIFSAPRLPWIELEPAVKLSGFVIIFSFFSDEIYSEGSSEPEDDSCLLRAVSLRPPKVAVPSQESTERVLKNSPTVESEKYPVNLFVIEKVA